MQRKLEADLEHPECRVRAENVVHDHHARAVHDADPNRGARPGGEVVGVGDRARTQLVQVEVGVAKLKQARAELVLVGMAVLLDETVGLERLQQAVDSRPGEAEPVGQLADAEAPWTAGEGLQDRRRPVDRLDRSTPSLAWVRIRHC